MLTTWPPPGPMNQQLFFVHRFKSKLEPSNYFSPLPRRFHWICTPNNYFVFRKKTVCIKIITSFLRLKLCVGVESSLPLILFWAKISIFALTGKVMTLAITRAGSHKEIKAAFTLSTLIGYNNLQAEAAFNCDNPSLNPATTYVSIIT